MFSRLAGKTVFITGASSGIGKQTAFEFARSGVGNLIITARRVEKLNELKNSILKEFPRVNVITLGMDVQESILVKNAINSLPLEFQEIDILVNNAGLVIGLDPLEKVQEAEMQIMLDTNVKGLIFVTQAILPLMRKRPWGCIVNVNSIAGTEAYANGSIYCASKHAVTAITKSLRHELMDTPINVVSIEPGLVETEFSIVRFRGDKSRADSVYNGITPLNATDIAETILFASSRQPHVQIASMVIFPTCQAAATSVFRK